MLTLNGREERFDFYKKVLVLVIPMALQNLLNTAVTSADVVMLGMVGETQLSASSLAGQVMFIMTLIFFGISSGAAVLTAQYWGKEDTVTIEKLLGFCIRMSMIVAVAFTLAALLLPNQIMRIFTNEPAVIAEGVKYLRIVALAYIFHAFTMVYLNIIRSIERVVISTVVYLVSLVVNVICNAVLIFGLFGFPALGIRGAAIGTLAAKIAEVVIALYYAYRMNHVVRIRMKYIFHSERLLVKDFIVYSVPVLANELLWGTGISAITAIIGRLGSSMVAANSVAQVIRQFATVVAMGVANATAIMVGKVIGEEKMDFAREYGKRFVRLSLIVGTLGSGVILFVSPFIKNFLTLTPEASQYLTTMLFIMAYYVIAQSLNTTMVVGVFRGGGDTRFGLAVDIFGLWGFAILLGFIAAFVLKLPPLWVYFILYFDELVKVPMVVWRYRTFKWLKNVTR